MYAFGLPRKNIRDERGSHRFVIAFEYASRHFQLHYEFSASIVPRTSRFRKKNILIFINFKRIVKGKKSKFIVSI